MGQQQVNLDFLNDEPKAAVSVNLDFLGSDPNQAVKDMQARKFGGGDRPAVNEPATPLFGEKWSKSPLVHGPLGLPAVNPGGVIEAGKTMASDLGGMIMTPIHAVLHPMDTAEALGRMREQQETQAGHEMHSAFNGGDYVDKARALTRLGINALPFGPSMNRMLDESVQNPAAGLGHAGAIMAAPKVVDPILDAASTPIATAKTIIGKVGDLAGEAADRVAGTTGGPKELITQAVKPYVRKLNWDKNLDRSMPHVAAAAETAGKDLSSPEGIGGLDGLLEHAKQAKKDVRAQFEATTGGRPVMVDLNPVADEMVNSISAKTKLEDPAKVADIVARADKYRKIVPQAEADELLQDTNAELEAYYNKYPAARGAALKKNPETALIDAQGRTLRKQLYDAMNPGNGGAVAANLQRDYGAIMELEQEAFRRKNVAARQAPATLSQQVAKWNAAGRVVGGVGSAGAALLGGASPSEAGLAGLGGEMVGAYAQGKMADWLRQRNSTDSLVNKAFSKLDARPAAQVATQPAPPLALNAAGTSATVQPQTTGSATPGQPLAAQGWNRPGAIQLPNSAEAQARVNAKGQPTSVAVRPRPGEPPVIDVVPTRLSPRPTVNGRIQLPGYGHDAAGYPLPASSAEPKAMLTTGDALRLDSKEAPIGTDPTTGKWKKLLKDEKGSVPIGGDDVSKTVKDTFINRLIATPAVLKKYTDGEILSNKTLRRPIGKLVDGLLSKTGRNGYIGTDGSVVDLGELTHPDAENYANSSDQKAIRFRSPGKDELFIELNNKPTRAQLDMIKDAILHHDAEFGVGYDLNYNGIHKYGTPEEFLKDVNRATEKQK